MPAILESKSMAEAYLWAIVFLPLAGLFDAVETLTWRAAQLGSTDLKRLWEKRKRLRDLLPR